MMMSPWEAVFWTSLFLVAHTYLLYPAMLFVAYGLAQLRRDCRYLARGADRRCRELLDHELPAVSLIIPAHNEEEVLPAKLANLAELDYPAERLEVVFVSDASTDRTNEILKRAERPGLRLVELSPHAGKSSALNHGVAAARHPILVFSDASTLFAADAVRKLVRHFGASNVGMACGTLGFQGNAEFQRTEGVYWRYEKALRVMESRLGATLTASGAIYALRREAWRPLTSDVMIDDFVVAFTARALGYEVVFDPEAGATDFAQESVAHEFARRVRLAVGSFRALGQLAQVRLDAFTSLAFFSHKVLRWVLPFLMMALLASSAALWDHPFYQAVLWIQLLFYAWAAAGYLFRDQMAPLRYGLMAYFLLAVNLAFLVGFVRYLSGRPEVKWKRAA